MMHGHKNIKLTPLCWLWLCVSASQNYWQHWPLTKCHRINREFENSHKHNYLFII